MFLWFLPPTKASWWHIYGTMQVKRGERWYHLFGSTQNGYLSNHTLEITNVFHNVYKVSMDELWKYNGKTVEVEFHNFFPFPLYGTQAECGISVVMVWN